MPHEADGLSGAWMLRGIRNSRPSPQSQHVSRDKPRSLSPCRKMETSDESKFIHYYKCLGWRRKPTAFNSTKLEAHKNHGKQEQWLPLTCIAGILAGISKWADFHPVMLIWATARGGRAGGRVAIARWKATGNKDGRRRRRRRRRRRTS